ncbi:patatin-like phospholipase family protein [Thaumasiovibrio subtropicus]|uniref:patatin-like phospholipase family protein n=1 Tax=Thaumasiovibrio subtropicus TaxID=1891207 RepID=UPI000B361950|nr:patatin-like phospholipase family protein [Thaumasiovibrio subtropicus]
MATTRSSKSKKPKVCLVLQGGGALGAYHIGAYQAMKEAGFEPDWFAGISIGALNSAILAGNEPENRLSQLETFWNRISRPSSDVVIPSETAESYNTISASQALLFGQPNFFTPRPVNPFFAFPGTEGAISFYSTAPLFSTMNDLCDFERINTKKNRLILGATRVTDGELIFFDNYKLPLGAEHPIASGSLPPGFPATRVGDEFYWDGGCVSNTPLDGILDVADENDDLLIFMVDLWNAHGDLPKTMNEVMWRQKEIQYASRSSHNISAIVDRHNLHNLQKKLEVGSEAVPNATNLKEGGKIDIVHITYDAVQGHIPLSDTEFSRRSIEIRRNCGYEDMTKAIESSPWTKRASTLNACVHRKDRTNGWDCGDKVTKITAKKKAS